MAAITLLRISLNGIKPVQYGLLSQCLNAPNPGQQIRTSKHWNPKFKWLRSKKVIKVDLPNFHEKSNEVSQEEKNRRLKERGVMPSRPWVERPISISTTSAVFEPYVPPEGDGKLSTFTKEGAKQKYELLQKKSKSMMTIRKIRSYEEDFDPKVFAQTAQEIYIQAHEAMIAKDRTKLSQYVTERLFPEITHNIDTTTIRWKFLRSLEPPRVVHARQTHVIAKENIFAQITVRLHSQQTLAVFDRFGRLLHGNEFLAKDVLEYVIFEKNISNLYGEWRMHHKIIPPWAEPRQPSRTTYRIIENDEDQDEEEKDQKKIEEEKKDAIESVQLESESSNKSPPLATA